MKEILVTTSLSPDSRTYLRTRLGEGVRVRYGDDLKPRELKDAAGSAQILLVWGSRADFDGLPVEAMTHLEMVQTLLAGVETLPFDKFPPRAIICSGQGALTASVAEHALALLLAAAKHVVWHHRHMVEGEFPQGLRESKALRGSTLVVVGVGDIGGEVARLGKALGMHVVGVNRDGRKHPWCDETVATEDLRAVLPRGDAVVLTVPLTKATQGLIGARELGAMKSDAIFINVARGKEVQEGPLYAHLQTHPTFTAGLDVWWSYPRGTKGRPFAKPFHQLDNVVMTPHVGGGISGFRDLMARAAIDNIARYLEGKEPRGRVRREDYL